jgi:hypothetical protein
MSFIPEKYEVLDIRKEDERRRITDIQSKAICRELQDAEDIPGEMIKKLSRTVTEVDHAIEILNSQQHPERAKHLAVVKDKAVDAAVKCIRKAENPRAIEIFSGIIATSWTTLRFLYAIINVEKQIATEKSKEEFRISFRNNRNLIENLVNA